VSTIKAKVNGRRLELDVPDDWPDGIEVEIHPSEQGTEGDADAMSPEDIAKTLAAMDLVEPFDMTDAEWAAWESDQKARKEWEKAHFAEHAEKLRRMWE
jgi:hypothetical protein